MSNLLFPVIEKAEEYDCFVGQGLQGQKSVGGQVRQVTLTSEAGQIEKY